MPSNRWTLARMNRIADRRPVRSGASRFCDPRRRESPCHGLIAPERRRWQILGVAAPPSGGFISWHSGPWMAAAIVPSDDPPVGSGRSLRPPAPCRKDSTAAGGLRPSYGLSHRYHRCASCPWPVAATMSLRGCEFHSVMTQWPRDSLTQRDYTKRTDPNLLDDGVDCPRVRGRHLDRYNREC
jgi:hypothetical protein